MVEYVNEDKRLDHEPHDNDFTSSHDEQSVKEKFTMGLKKT